MADDIMPLLGFLGGLITKNASILHLQDVREKVVYVLKMSNGGNQTTKWSVQV
jgi:hypothetical protein